MKHTESDKTVKQKKHSRTAEGEAKVIFLRDRKQKKHSILMWLTGKGVENAPLIFKEYVSFLKYLHF